MAGLSSFDDPRILAMIDRITVEPDESVAYPAALAHIVLADQSIAQLQERRSFADFSLNRDEVRAQLMRLSAEESVPGQCVELIESYAFAAGGKSSPEAVVQAYALARAGESAWKNRTLAA